MADNIPDFRVQTPSVNPTAFADVLQRKQNAEDANMRAEEQRKNDRLKRVLEAVQGGQMIATNMMNMAQKRQELKDQQSMSAGQEKVTNILSSPAPQPPAPTASSTVIPSGPFPVSPSPEDTAAYQQKIDQRKQNLAAALAQAQPKTVDAILAKQQYGLDKTYAPTYEAKTVLLNGLPTSLGYNPRDNSYYRPGTNEKVTGDIQPFVQGEQTPLTDTDRKRLDVTAQAVIDGRADPAKLVNMRGQDKGKLTQLIGEKDPTFDLSLAPQRVAIRKEFTTGTANKNLTALNTTIQHTDTLDKAIDAISNKKLRVYNTVGNYLNNETGAPEVKQFKAALNAVVTESAKVFQGAGVVTNDERKALKDSIESSDSPAQMHAAVDTWMELMGSKTGVLKDNWNQTMAGMKPPTPFLSAKSKAILEKRGYDTETMQKKERAPLDSFFK